MSYIWIKIYQSLRFKREQFFIQLQIDKVSCVWLHCPTKAKIHLINISNLPRKRETQQKKSILIFHGVSGSAWDQPSNKTSSPPPCKILLFEFFPSDGTEDEGRGENGMDDDKSIPSISRCPNGISSPPIFFASSFWRGPWISGLSLPPTRIVVTIRDIPSFPPLPDHETCPSYSLVRPEENLIAREKEEQKRRVEIETLMLKDWCVQLRDLSKTAKTRWDMHNGTGLFQATLFSVLHISVDLINWLYMLFHSMFSFFSYLNTRSIPFFVRIIRIMRHYTCSFQIINLFPFSLLFLWIPVILEWEREREERILISETRTGIADFTGACIQF